MLLVGMENGTATLEVSLVISYKTLPMQSNSSSPWYLPKGVESLCPHKNLHTDVYSSFIYNYQNLGATKMSFNR